ncbi:MAG: DUF1566 domain-containing protein [Desulfobulbaceae bacterium]|nr:DUF1566 domain-containing protein [Desulfobulbaceae bacterium]
MTFQGIIQTGQHSCFNEDGAVVDCAGSGQDGEYQIGTPWPDPRFRLRGQVVEDLLTGLCWATDANPAEFPLTWQEAFEFIRAMNARSASGYSDWRLPDRNELRSLISYQAKRPALPAGHPFVNVFSGWYWTSTTAAVNSGYAWYVHMDGARMFYGGKNQYYMLWPVRGKSTVLPPAGEAAGSPVEERQESVPEKKEPESRFVPDGDIVHDRHTGLCWRQTASLSSKPVRWAEALQLVAGLNQAESDRKKGWRLPNINELESLVDCSRHSPALEVNHPFTEVRDVYWSSTTSFFETDWAWALYLNKGALGVGFKKQAEFYIWPVRNG